jgi:plasmid maintenance system antidote protein VapI
MGDFTTVVERYMDARGLGVRATARAAGLSDHSMLSKVLNGRRSVTPYIAAKLDRALGASGEIVAAAQSAMADASAAQSSARSAAIPAAKEQPGRKRERPPNYLHAEALGDPFESLRQRMNEAFNRGAMTDAVLDDWERTALRYGRATRDRPASVLIGDLGRDLEELNGLLTCPLSVSAMRRLTRVAAQMSGLMCLAFCLLDDRPAFRRWARTARLAGREAGDPETLSWILAQEAHGHYYSGDLLEAIDVAGHGYEVSRVPCAGTALAAALEARAQATLGRDKKTRDALARAEDALSHLGGEALIPSALGYNEASFRFHEGNAYTHLGDVKSAIKAQDRALELCDPDNYTDWSMTRLDRALCLIRADEIAEGLRYALETVERLDESRRRGIISLRAKTIVQSLPEKAKSLPAVRDIGELLTLTGGTESQ